MHRESDAGLYSATLPLFLLIIHQSIKDMKDFYYFQNPMTVAGQDYVREKHYDKPSHYVNLAVEYPNDIK